jgi:hypothetical protein
MSQNTRIVARQVAHAASVFPRQPNRHAPTTRGLRPVDRTFERALGKVRPMILLWALGVPIPIVLIILLVRGCSG